MDKIEIGIEVFSDTMKVMGTVPCEIGSATYENLKSIARSHNALLSNKLKQHNKEDLMKKFEVAEKKRKEAAIQQEELKQGTHIPPIKAPIKMPDVQAIKGN